MERLNQSYKCFCFSGRNLLQGYEIKHKINISQKNDVKGTDYHSDLTCSGIFKKTPKALSIHRGNMESKKAPRNSMCKGRLHWIFSCKIIIQGVKWTNNKISFPVRLLLLSHFCNGTMVCLSLHNWISMSPGQGPRHFLFSDVLHWEKTFIIVRNLFLLLFLQCLEAFGCS